MRRTPLPSTSTTKSAEFALAGRFGTSRRPKTIYVPSGE
jgi:hypothetical protein